MVNIGPAAEGIACDYLVGKGYKIVDRNYRERYGEIDIVSLNPNGTLVFVEVKALGGEGSLMPEDHFTSKKKERLVKTCSFYANSHPELVRKDRGWRLDLLALTLRADSGSILSEPKGLTKDNESFEIKHYENVLGG